MRNIFLLLLAAYGFYFVMPDTAAALQSKAKLRILPIDCVFETINDGTNEIRYITPQQCGQIINLPPSIAPSRPNSPITNIPEGQILRQAIRTDQPSQIFLNEYSSFWNSSGLKLVLRQGQIVYYLIRVGAEEEIHSVTAKEVGKDYMVLTIASKPFDAKLFRGETKQFDVTENDKKDIEITLVAISQDGAELVFKSLDSSQQIFNDMASYIPAAAIPKESAGLNFLYLAVGIAILTIIIRRKK